MRSRLWALSLALPALALACGGDSSSPIGTSIPADREGRWQQDIDSLARQLPDLHANLFFRLPRSRFEAEIAALRAAVPSLSDAAIVVGLMRILALVGDAHTSIDTRTVAGFRQIPLRFEWFEDGIFVVGATEPHRDGLGLRLRRVGDAPVEAVVEALREVISHENESWLRFSLVSTLTIPEVLEAQILVPDAARIRLELVDVAGVTTVLEVAAEARGALDLLDAGPDVLPLYRQRPEENYWSAFLEDAQTLYVHYRRASDSPAEPFSTFASRVVQTLDTEPVRALVLDLRHNTGGNSSLFEPLLQALERRPRWSSGDGLYTIVGRATFSSGIINALDSKRRTRAILVGEPTGGKPNHFGEVRSFTLFHSGIRVLYSTRFFRLLDGSDPPSLEPDVAAELSSRDYLEGRDPVLETVASFVGR